MLFKSNIESGWQMGRLCFKASRDLISKQQRERERRPVFSSIKVLTVLASQLWLSPSLPPFVLVDRRRSNLYTGFCRGETCHQHLLPLLVSVWRWQGSTIALLQPPEPKGVYVGLAAFSLLLKKEKHATCLYSHGTFLFRGLTTTCFSSLCHSGIQLWAEVQMEVLVCVYGESCVWSMSERQLKRASVWAETVSLCTSIMRERVSPSCLPAPR